MEVRAAEAFQHSADQLPPRKSIGRRYGWCDEPRDSYAIRSSMRWPRAADPKNFMVVSARNIHSRRAMRVRAAGIRTSATTDWLPNAGIARSSDRTAPGRTSRFSAADRSLQVTFSLLDRRGRVECARLLVTGDNNRQVGAPPTGPAPRSNSSGFREWCRQRTCGIGCTPRRQRRSARSTAKPA